ncbi:MAG TPA: polyketide cyclase [Prolixibacteraceae bacterium]|jgi:carbon monoxide dehydrogenase subunit G|nr:polyketide cyclase [Prolixibacteraceae bacterium]
MGVSKYVSDVKIIRNNQEIIYNYLSNFENLSKYINEGLLEKMTEQIPQIKISNFESDADSCRFQISGLGLAEIRIIEREPFKTIKVSSSGSLPVSIVFWIQLLPVDAYETKMRLVLDADMSMMIKMMVNKKLEEGINRMADMLAALPYK